MDAKTEWNQWLDEIEREADDLDNLAHAFEGEGSPFRTDAFAFPPRHMTEVGKEACREAVEAVAAKRREVAEALREHVKQLREMPEHAKWLGAKRRERVLEVVALTGDAHSAARARLPKASQRAIGWNGRRLDCGGDHPRIARIVAGARLWTVRRKP